MPTFRFFVLTLFTATAFGLLKSSLLKSSGKINFFVRGTVVVKANLIDTVSASGKFNTLVKAINAADLTNTLKGPGPFTIFAPNDDAFSRLPPGNLDSLMKDPQSLRNLLLFHIVPEKMSPSRNGKNWDTLHIDEGGDAKQLTVKVKNWSETKVHDTFIVTGQEPIPKVLTFDMVADNGNVHEMDAVLIPYADKMPPKISHIGIGDLYGNRTIQAGYYGGHTGTDRFGKVYEGPERDFEPIPVGNMWEYAGNWETRIPDKIYKDAHAYEEKGRSTLPQKASPQGAVSRAVAPKTAVAPVVAAAEEKVSSMTGKTTCMRKELDKNGRCPGEAGYVSFAKEAPADFAAFKAEMAAKKAAAAANKK